MWFSATCEIIKEIIELIYSDFYRTPVEFQEALRISSAKNKFSGTIQRMKVWRVPNKPAELDNYMERAQ